MIWLGAFVFSEGVSYQHYIRTSIQKTNFAEKTIVWISILCSPYQIYQKTQRMENTTLQGYISRMLGGNGSDGVSGKLDTWRLIDLYQPAPIFVAQPILKSRDVDMKKESCFQVPIVQNFSSSW